RALLRRAGRGTPRQAQAGPRRPRRPLDGRLRGVRLSQALPREDLRAPPRQHPPRPGPRRGKGGAPRDGPPGRRRRRRSPPEASDGTSPRSRHPEQQKRRRGVRARHDPREFPRRRRRGFGRHARPPRFYRPAREDRRTHARRRRRRGRPLHAGGHGRDGPQDPRLASPHLLRRRPPLKPRNPQRVQRRFAGFPGKGL
ncbi:MAG: Hydrolase, alpha/beta fold family, partial [uncultured Rubrobacteraceae bacterium]